MDDDARDRNLLKIALCVAAAALLALGVQKWPYGYYTLERIIVCGVGAFGMHQHTLFWKQHDARKPDKGFGTTVVKSWCWYQNWVTYIVDELSKRRDAAQA
jgi:hypothetical protein